MGFNIRQESPLQEDVRTMVEELNAHMRPLSPPEFQFQLTADQMAEPGVSVFVVRNRQGDAIGMGSLKQHSPELGEIKRMFTRPAIRGSGIGRAIIDAIEAKAKALGLKRLVLETGSTPGFEPAWRVYERHGYTQCGPVLDYPDSEFNRFYEKALP